MPSSVALELADLREGLALEQHPAVAAQRLGERPGLLHLLDRHRVVVVDDRQRRQHRDRRVRRAEHEVGPAVDREAELGVVAAVRLREAGAEAVGVGVEEVRLHVDDDLGLDGRRRAPPSAAVVSVVASGGTVKVPPAGRRRRDSFDAGGEGDQRRRRPHRRAQERPAVDPERAGRSSASASARRPASTHDVGGAGGTYSPFEHGAQQLAPRSSSHPL